jgi:hypothetical protein
MEPSLDERVYRLGNELSTPVRAASTTAFAVRSSPGPLTAGVKPVFFLFDSHRRKTYSMRRGSQRLCVFSGNESGGKMKISTKFGLFIILGATLLLVTVGNSTAGSLSPSMGSGFRCGNLLMSEGVDKLQVLSNCGQPIASEKSYIDQYGEVEKLVYGPDAGYYHVLYFFAGKLIGMEDIRQ